MEFKIEQERIQAAFHSSTLAAGGLLGTAAILCCGEWARRRGVRAVREEPVAAPQLTFGQAFLVGCAQALAIHGVGRYPRRPGRPRER